MELVQYTVKLDLTDNGCFDTGWRIKQGDSGSSQISAIIVNNDEPVISALNPPRIVFKRPDGKSIVGNMTLSGSRYFYTFVGNELEIAGPVIMDVKFEDESGRASTASCKFTCVEDTLGYDPSGSSTYSNPVSTLIEVAEERAVDSEAWAVGKRNGVDVEPGDETYHNNAKYWSQQSKGGGGGGSVVEWNQRTSSGTHIADITIDGNKTEIYAPTGGGAGTYASLPDKPSINGTTLETNIDITVPTMLSELESDSTHRLVTDNQIANWGDYSRIINKPIFNNKTLNAGNNTINLTDLADVFVSAASADNVLIRTSSSWIAGTLGAQSISARWTISGAEYTGKLNECISSICSNITNLNTAVGNANELLEVALYGES